MIQLYKASNTEFTSNGDFTLDPVITKAELSVELNGTWELTLTAVIEDSGRALEIEQTDVIKVPTFQSDEQLYRVRKVKPNHSTVSVTCDPIFLDSKGDVFLSLIHI